MEQYWVSMIIQNDNDKRAWLCSITNYDDSLEDAIKTINYSKENHTVLSAWVDKIDKENHKQTVFHECYVDVLGYVR